MATVANEADEIRRQMALIRHDLHADVRQVVKTAEAAVDWQRYIRKYPWLAVGLAFGLGYAVVPKRRVPSDVARAADVAEVRETVAQTVKEETPRAEKPSGPVGTVWAVVSPIAIRLAQSYAVQYLENWLLSQQQHAAAGPPPPRDPSQTGWSGGRRGPGPV